MWQQMTDDEYFGRPNCYGSSDLKKVLKSPAHTLIESKTTKAMDRGSLVHQCLLLGLKPVVKPKFDMRTNVGKAASELWDEENQHPEQTICSAADYEIVMRAMDAVHSHPAARLALQHTSSVMEQPGIVSEGDFELRIKPDIRNPDLAAIFDLKTISDASGDNFARQATNLMYWMQAALYLDVAKRLEPQRYAHFFFIVLETNPPFGCRVFDVDSTGLDLGREQYQLAVETIKRCRTTKKWPAYSSEIEVLVPPAYAMYWSGND